MNKDSDDYKKIKIVLVGDVDVGKTTLAKSFSGQEIKKGDVEKDILPIQTFTNNVNILDDVTISLDVVCLSGQKEHRKTNSFFYHAAHAVVFVYDINNPDSFNELRSFYRDFKEHNAKIPAVLVGNKVDLERHVKLERVLEWARENKMRYMEVSPFVEDGEMVVERMFDRLSYVAYSTYLEKQGRLPLEKEEWSYDESSEELESFEVEDDSSESEQSQDSKDPHQRLQSYVRTLSKLQLRQCSKNNVERGLAKANYLENNYLKNNDELSYFQLTKLLGNPNQILENRSRLPFKPYKLRCLFLGKYNEVLDRVCESKTEELLVDYYNSVKPE